MLKKFNNFFRLLKKLQSFIFSEARYFNRLNIALSKGSIASKARIINNQDPTTWEFSGFSQNGEDGIIEILLKNLSEKNRYFVEIGFSDGLENNTSWLAIVKKFNGLAIDGNSELVNLAKKYLSQININIKFVNKFLNLENIQDIKELIAYNNPDLFSLDIDGNDYYIAKAVLDMQITPKIFVVEYNSVFGPLNSLAVEYDPKFDFHVKHSSGLYFGVSIQAWKNLFKNYGYEFITVDLNGVNAFFVDPNYFDSNFLLSLKGLNFQENFVNKIKFNLDWNKQFELIKKMPFKKINNYIN